MKKLLLAIALTLILIGTDLTPEQAVFCSKIESDYDLYISVMKVAEERNLDEFELLKEFGL